VPEEIAATPGWVDERLDELFSALPRDPEVEAVRLAYSSCLAACKSPSVPSDMLGAEFNDCRATLHLALRAAGIGPELQALEGGLEALEAEIASDS
jgi:hypothetical protein